MNVSMEDKLASKIIKNHADVEGVNINTEVHYNYYGDRGVVDLVAEKTEHPDPEDVEEKSETWNMPYDWTHDQLVNDYIWIFEIKSESALNSVSGANEVIRQFNRHREFFFKGSKFNRSDYDSAMYCLAFIPTPMVYQHVSDNEQVYKNLSQKSDVSLEWRHPNSPFNFPVYSSRFGNWSDVQSTYGLNQSTIT